MTCRWVLLSVADVAYVTASGESPHHRSYSVMGAVSSITSRLGWDRTPAR